MQERKYLPTLGELIDRLSIIQLKEVFITNRPLREMSTLFAAEEHIGLKNVNWFRSHQVIL